MHIPLPPDPQMQTQDLLRRHTIGLCFWPTASVGIVLPTASGRGETNPRARSRHLLKACIARRNMDQSNQRPAVGLTSNVSTQGHKELGFVSSAFLTTTYICSMSKT
eukprot:2175930-Amphidinium_carterae.1